MGGFPINPDLLNQRVFPERTLQQMLAEGSEGMQTFRDALFIGSPTDFEPESLGDPLDEFDDVQQPDSLPPFRLDRLPELPAPRNPNGIKALLADFIQNFGKGLQAQPVGSGFASSLGAALAAPRDREIDDERRKSLLNQIKLQQRRVAAQEEQNRLSGVRTRANILGQTLGGGEVTLGGQTFRVPGFREQFLLRNSGTAKRLGLDLGDPKELAIIGVLAGNGVNLADDQSILDAVARPEIQEAIGKAVSKFGPQAQRTVAERLTVLRGFDPNTDPKAFADEVEKVQRRINSASPRTPQRRFGPPPKSTRDAQAGFVIEDIFGITPPRPGFERLGLAGANRFQRLRVKLSELIRRVGDEDGVREFVAAAQEALGPNATPEGILEAVEDEVKNARGGRRFERRR